MDTTNLSIIIVYIITVICTLLTIRGLYRLIVWSKKMPKGAFIFLAVFPIISLFPIPPQEIKKLERIKQEQLKEEDENGEQKDKQQKENSEI